MINKIGAKRFKTDSDGKYLGEINGTKCDSNNNAASTEFTKKTILLKNDNFFNV